MLSNLIIHNVCFLARTTGNSIESKNSRVGFYRLWKSENVEISVVEIENNEWRTALERAANWSLNVCLHTFECVNCVKCHNQHKQRPKKLAQNNVQCTQQSIATTHCIQCIDCVCSAEGLTHTRTHTHDKSSVYTIHSVMDTPFNEFSPIRKRWVCAC